MTRVVRAPRVLAAALIGLAALGGCNIQKLAADNMAPVFSKTKAKFNRSSIPRAAREAAPGLLVTLDGILAASPDNEELLLLQAELQAGFAFGMIEDEYRALARADKEAESKELRAWANELYLGARSSAKRALGNICELALAAAESGPVESIPEVFAEELDEDAVGAVFWTGFSWGAYINLNLDKGTEVIKDLPRVKALMQWVLDTDETYFNGGAHLFFALLNLSVGKTVGGSPPEGLKHLEAVDRITGNKLLMSKVFFAEYYLPQVQTPSGDASAEERMKVGKETWNRYLATLKGVMEAPDELWPEQRLLNELAKRRAEDLYYRADDILFEPPGVEVPRRPGYDDEFSEDEDDSDEDDSSEDDEG